MVQRTRTRSTPRRKDVAVEAGWWRCCERRFSCCCYHPLRGLCVCNSVVHGRCQGPMGPDGATSVPKNPAMSAMGITPADGIRIPLPEPRTLRDLVAQLTDQAESPDQAVNKYGPCTVARVLLTSISTHQREHELNGRQSPTPFGAVKQHQEKR